ncbi:MAG: Macrolide export ATP-binding/permease protein MacB (EC [uncultured Caballeronia sp.]|nr:MAG: Macrolide export ATP-binding/permease protein MacB (EC [uncultured Caballeronia sp.]
MHGIELTAGAFFGSRDVQRQKPVVVIDDNTRQRLFGSTPPLGKILLVDNFPCVVIGIAQASDAFAGNGNGNLNVWLPYTTASSRLFGRTDVDNITVRVKDGQPSEAAERNIVRQLTRRHGTKDFFHVQRGHHHEGSGKHEPVADLAALADCTRLADGWRHWCDERDAGLGDGARSGDRHSHGRGRTHAGPIFFGSS